VVIARKTVMMRRIAGRKSKKKKIKREKRHRIPKLLPPSLHTTPAANDSDFPAAYVTARSTGLISVPGRLRSASVLEYPIERLPGDKMISFQMTRKIDCRRRKMTLPFQS